MELLKTIEELEGLKNNLFELSHAKQYQQIISILNNSNINIDSAIDYIYCDNGIITSEDAESIAENELSNGGLDRLRCFIGDTYAADIYMIDGYGNLKNITDNDIETLIDEVIQILKDNQ